MATLASGINRVGNAVVPPLDTDPVLAALAQAEESYRAFRSGAEHQSARLAEAESQLTSTSDQLAGSQLQVDRLQQQLEETRSHLEAERRQAERERERAAKLSDIVRDVHRSLF